MYREHYVVRKIIKSYVDFRCVFVYRLTDTQFKLDALDKDPYALDSLARPLPFRGQHTHTHALLSSRYILFLIISGLKVL